MAVWSFLCHDDYPEYWQADLVECDECHDPERELEPGQFWRHEEPEVDDVCSHCGAEIVDENDLGEH